MKKKIVEGVGGIRDVVLKIREREHLFNTMVKNEQDISSFRLKISALVKRNKQLAVEVRATDDLILQLAKKEAIVR
jgi:hypothetical protein